ncbi:MAG TPA: hypothetical protein VII43_02485 [Opitutaceae bacterium]
MLPFLALCALAYLTQLPCRGATKWTRLEAPNFTILSALSERETRDWGVEFEQFHRGARKFINVNESALQPVTIVLFGDDRDMKPYKPLENGRPADMAGVFLRCGLGNFIEASAYFQDELTRLIIYHESVHWLTNVSDAPLPLWLNEGLTETFSSFKVDGKISRYGDALPWHVALLNRSKMIPLKELVNIPQGSLLYNEGQRTSIFYAESWAFVHYLLFSGKLDLHDKFNELVRELPPGADPDAAFMKVFGVNCAGMDKRLAEYLHHGAFTLVTMNFDPKAIAESFTIRPATRTEVDLTLTCLQSAVGRPEEALPRLDRMAETMPNNPLVWEARGFAAFCQRDYGETLDCFRKAETLGSRDYFVYSFLGDQALGADPDRTGTQTVLNGSGRVAADYYEKDLAINPSDKHAYDNIALNIYPMDAVTNADLHALNLGLAKYPHDASIWVGIASVYLKNGKTELGLTTLRAIAENHVPEDADAAACAKLILDNRLNGQVSDRMNALVQTQDFDGVVAYADETLKTPISPGLRDQVVRQRAWAAVAGKVHKAVQLLNDGSVEEGRRLLLEADAENTDPQMRQSIQDILSKIPVHPSP